MKKRFTFNVSILVGLAMSILPALGQTQDYAPRDYSIVPPAPQVAALSAWCISPELTIPRIGDKLAFFRMKYSPHWIDSMHLCPDYSQPVLVLNGGRVDMKIYAPSACDFVSSFVVVRGKENIQLIQRGDTLFQRRRITPGRRRIYDTMPIYGMPVALVTKDTIISHGKSNMIGEFKTGGVWTTTKIGSLTAITLEADTLRDVECVQTDIEETLIYTNPPDTTQYKGMVRQWYAPGYRYPILSHESGTLFSLVGDTLDAVNNWYLSILSQQRANIKDDPVNELIRNRYENMKFENQFNPGDNNNDPSANTNSGHVYYDSKRKCVIINPTFAMDDGMSAYILCDISGIVYTYGILNTEGAILPTEDYAPGTYIVHISTSSEPIIYKFIIATE